MSVKSRAVTVGTTAVRLDVAEADNAAGMSVAVANTGAADVFLGGPDVTTTTGYPLSGGQQLSVELQRGEALWAVGTTSTSTRVLQAGA